MMKRLLPLLAFLLAALHLRASENLETFAKWLPGTYSTEKADNKNSKTPNLCLHVVPMWQGYSDGPWFYLEQVDTAKPEKPTRQVVLHLVENEDGTITCENWDIRTKAKWVGAWSSPEKFEAMTKKDLNGFSSYFVYTREADGSFKGGTPDDMEFTSNFQGASRFTNVSVLTANSYYTWDRGYTDKGKLVWGPSKTGYLLAKLE
jgi:hypothetical protein